MDEGEESGEFAEEKKEKEIEAKKEEEEKNPVLFKLYEYLKTIKKTSTKKAKG